MPNLIKKFQNTVFEHSLFEKGDKIVLGISGGPDSVAMLDIFKKIEKKYSLKLIIAHVNYGLRGHDSKKDEEFTKSLAEKYKIRIFVLRPAVETHCNASLRERKNISENALRDIRYAFFEKIRKENKFDLIAIAHNADDQAETFLARIIRGAGIHGLSAMKYKNNKIIRPLLDVSRKEISDYLKERKIKYRTDKTNLESKYLRNKIRNKLLPFLEKNFNPGIRKTILESVKSIAQDADYLQKESAKTLKKTELSASEILKKHPAIQRRTILEAVKKEKSNLKNISSAHIREILKIAKSTKSKRQVVVIEGLKITRKGDRLEIAKILTKHS